MIARSTGSPLVVAAITPVPWPPSPFLGDEEYLTLQQTAAQDALDRARQDHRCRRRGGVPDRVGPLGHRRAAAGQRTRRSRVWSCWAPARRACPAGSRWAASPSASCTVSTRRSASHPRATRSLPTLGSAGSPWASAAPTPTPGCSRPPLERATQFDIPLRVACFAVRSSSAQRGHHRARRPKTSSSASGRTRSGRRSARRRPGPGPTRSPWTSSSAAGTGWEETIATLPWGPTDLLAIGAKTSAISRFLLGSHAAKIVKHSPVPVLTVARASLT